jgi:hypothetical protein
VKLQVWSFLLCHFLFVSSFADRWSWFC